MKTIASHFQLSKISLTEVSSVACSNGIDCGGLSDEFRYASQAASMIAS